MPKDNWAQNRDMHPVYVPDELKHLLPGYGMNRRPDFIADPEAEPEVHITAGEEKYGIGWREGDPIPKKKVEKPHLIPGNEHV